MAAQAGAGEGAARKERKARMGRRWWSSLGSGKDHGGATGEEPSTEWDYSLITAPQDPSLSLFFPLLSNLSLLATKERRNEKSVTPFPSLSLSVQWVSSRLHSPISTCSRKHQKIYQEWFFLADSGLLLFPPIRSFLIFSTFLRVFLPPSCREKNFYV